MSKDYPDLGQFDRNWSMQDQTELEHLRIKYENIPRITEHTEPEWMGLRKIAEKNRLTADGKPNPHYPRMKIEADMARLQYELCIMVRVNAILFEQVQLQSMCFERIGILEGAYAYIRNKLDGVFNIHQDSVKKHYADRKEWHTQSSMRRSGLDPDKKEDRLLWARKLDELNEKMFAVTEKVEPPPTIDPFQKNVEVPNEIDYVDDTNPNEEQENETT
jgi:hypothetical protein